MKMPKSCATLHNNMDVTCDSKRRSALLRTPQDMIEPIVYDMQFSTPDIASTLRLLIFVVFRTAGSGNTQHTNRNVMGGIAASKPPSLPSSACCG